MAVTHILGSALIVVAVILLLGSTIVYGTQFRWWHDPTGRHLFAFMAVFALAVTLWGGRLLTIEPWQAINEPGAWPVIRLAVFVLVDWVLGWRLLIIIRALPGERRRRRREKGESREREDRG